MLFNSLEFAIFLPLVFILYWLIPGRSLKIQNILIVVASYIFYAWWDWRFLSLICISTLVDYAVGFGLSVYEKKTVRKFLLLISLFTNLGLLAFFKYYNFFVESFIDAFTFLGMKPGTVSLNLILPVGISFYTFQTLSYSIDVYRRKIQATGDLISFAAFVSFFPQLVAGPIERATNLLPQFRKERNFEYSSAVEGMRQILWGLFKKVVIADSCAVYANQIFADSGELSGAVLFLGAIFFAFQIYGDFSGYSDIAIGTARLFGFQLKKNFNFPYFSRDIAEFWRKWHISLSSWFRDYVYIPLGGNRGTLLTQVRNVLVVFLISGFWHGANWTFLAWGLLNALYFLPLLVLKRNRKNLDIPAEGKLFPGIKESIAILVTFGLTIFAWVFFRAESLEHAFQYIGNMLKHPGSFLLLSVYKKYSATLIAILAFSLIEWFSRTRDFPLERIDLFLRKPLRYSLYAVMFIAILYFNYQEQEFIYFQF